MNSADVNVIHGGPLPPLSKDEDHDAPPSEAPSSPEPDFLVTPDQIVLFIPIVAIVTWGAVSITKLWIRHRERLAMIREGMNPDQAPAGQKRNDG
jgi:hypothetical protein